LRRTLSVRLSVRPVIVAIGNVFSTTASVTSRHLANYNDTCTFRHAQTAAYRMAISAAQACFNKISIAQYCLSFLPTENTVPNRFHSFTGLPVLTDPCVIRLRAVV